MLPKASHFRRMHARLSNLISPEEMWLIAGTLVVAAFLSWIF